MCPVTGTTAMTALAITSAATAAGSMYMQHEQAEAQADYQDQMYSRNKQNSYDALAQRYGDIGQRQSQEQQAAAEKQEEITRQARAKMATARVMAGESGVSGNSVDMALRDISGAAARDRSTVDQNLEWTMGQLQRQKTSAQTNAKNRINSVQPGQEPSDLALGVGLANTAANGYMQYSSVAPQSGGSVAPQSGGSGTGNSLKGQGGFGSQVKTGGY